MKSFKVICELFFTQIQNKGHADLKSCVQWFRKNIWYLEIVITEHKKTSIGLVFVRKNFSVSMNKNYAQNFLPVYRTANIHFWSTFTKLLHDFWNSKELKKAWCNWNNNTYNVCIKFLIISIGYLLIQMRAHRQVPFKNIIVWR